MGERGNIVVKQNAKGHEGEKVYFYTHWRGYRIKQVLQNALKHDQRWTDETYLARIIFCELVDGEEKVFTSFGISTYLTDNGYPILVVDAETQSITEESESGEVLKTWTFSDFVADTFEKQ